MTSKINFKQLIDLYLILDDLKLTPFETFYIDLYKDLRVMNKDDTSFLFGEMYNRQNEMSKISKRNVQKKEKRPSWLSRFFDSFFNLSSYKIWVEYNRQNQKCKKN